MKRLYMLLATFFLTYTAIAQCEIEAEVDVFSCEGAEITIFSSETGLVYQWFLENEIIAGGTTNNVLFVTESGMYTVVVTTTDEEQCELVITVIIPEPPVALEPTPFTVCGENCFGDFSLNEKNDEITGGIADLIVSYHETLADAENNTNHLGDPYINVVPCFQKIYVRVEDPATGCFTIVPLELIVADTPVAVEPTPLIECGDDCIAVFSLNEKDAEITGGNPSYVITYHETIAEADENIGALFSPYTNVVPCFQKIYARVEDPATGCFTIVSLELIVAEAPEIVTAPDDLALIDTDDDGIEVFDLTVNEPQMLGNQNPAQHVFTYYLSEADCFAQINPLVDPTAFENEVNSQTIFVNLQDIETGCFVCTAFVLELEEELGIRDTNLDSFQLTPNPAVDTITIDFARELNSVQASVLSVNGQVVLQRSFKSATNFTLDVSTLHSGIYFIQTISEEGKSIQKFIKK